MNRLVLSVLNSSFRVLGRVFPPSDVGVVAAQRGGFEWPDVLSDAEEEVSEPRHRCAACGRVIGESAIVPAGGGYACSVICEKRLAAADAVMHQHVKGLTESLIDSLKIDPVLLSTIQRQLNDISDEPQEMPDELWWREPCVTCAHGEKSHLEGHGCLAGDCRCDSYRVGGCSCASAPHNYCGAHGAAFNGTHPGNPCDPHSSAPASRAVVAEAAEDGGWLPPSQPPPSARDIEMHRGIAVVASDHCYEIRKLHRSYGEGSYCLDCNKAYPCPTIRILDRPAAALYPMQPQEKPQERTQ